MTNQGYNLSTLRCSETARVPEVIVNFFNQSTSVCYSLPFNTIQLRERIQNDFREFIKIEGGGSSLYYLLGVILVEKLLTSPNQEQLLQQIGNSFNRVCNLKETFNDERTMLRNIQRSFLEFVQIMDDSPKLAYQAKSSKKRALIGKIISEETKKDSVVGSILIQVARCLLLNQMIEDIHSKNAQNCYEAMMNSLWEVNYKFEKQLLETFAKIFDLSITVLVTSDSHYRQLSFDNNPDESDRVFILDVFSTHKTFKGILYPLISSGLPDEERLNSSILNKTVNLENSQISIKNSMISMKNEQQQSTFINPNVNGSLVLSQVLSPFVQQSQQQPISSVQISQVENLQQSQTMFLLGKCDLCKCELSEELIFSNPGCSHSYCVYCLMSSQDAFPDVCHIENCFSSMNKTKLEQFVSSQKFVADSSSDDSSSILSSQLSGRPLAENTNNELNKASKNQNSSNNDGTHNFSNFANQTKQKADEKYQCPISSLVYNSTSNIPRVLPCGHTLGQSVLNNIMRLDSDEFFECPLDGVKIEKNKIDTYPINYVLMNDSHGQNHPKILKNTQNPDIDIKDLEQEKRGSYNGQSLTQQTYSFSSKKSETQQSQKLYPSYISSAQSPQNSQLKYSSKALIEQQKKSSQIEQQQKRYEPNPIGVKQYINRLESCSEKIDEWIDSNEKASDEKKQKFLKQVSDQFDQFALEIEKKKQEALKQVSEKLQNQNINKSDVEIFSWWKVKFGNEKEQLQKLKKEGESLSEEGKQHYDTWIKQVEGVLEQAKSSQSSIPTYYFDNLVLDSLRRMISDAKVDMIDNKNNNTKTLKLVVPKRDIKENYNSRLCITETSQ